MLGISGGQDSTLAGKLAQLAIDELNAEAGEDKYTFIAVSLPFGVQFDEEERQMALDFIQPSKRIRLILKKQWMQVFVPLKRQKSLFRFCKRK